MYFLSEEERRLVLRRLAPEARKHGVADELRGWNWDRPPLEPIYDTRLQLSEVAGQHCPTARDVYLARALHVEPQPGPALVGNAYLHQVLGAVVLTAKRILYAAEGDPLEALIRLAQPRLPVLPAAADDTLLERGTQLWHYEYLRIAARVQEALAAQPGIATDALVAMALPVIAEQRMDGTFLGLTRNSTVDGYVWTNPMVVTVQFGAPQEADRLSLAGYALVLESLHEHPVDLGCAVYVTFARGRVLVEREFHVIDDELRQWFIEARDERARLVEEEIDPGLPDECPVDCPYLRACHPDAPERPRFATLPGRGGSPRPSRGRAGAGR